MAAPSRRAHRGAPAIVCYSGRMATRGELGPFADRRLRFADRKSTRLNSSHRCISYAVFCLKKKKKKRTIYQSQNKNELDKWFTEINFYYFVYWKYIICTIPSYSHMPFMISETPYHILMKNS